MSSPTPHRLALQPKRSSTTTTIVPHCATPVSQATVELQAFSFQNHNSTNNNKNENDDGSALLLSFPDATSSSSFPHRRNNYVCSPILESPIHLPPDNNNNNTYATSMDSTTTTANHPYHHHNNTMTMMMTTVDTIGDDELPTAGSLHKVRRIHKSDDIFAASHHHLSHLRQSVLQLQHNTAVSVVPPPPTIDTSKLGYVNDDEEDISPTDVTTALFPPSQKFFAPTPVVPKHGPPPTPMKPARGSNVLLFTTSSSTNNNTTTQPQYTPYTHSQSHQQHSPSRRDTSPSSPVGLPPVLTRKVLQPRTPLVTLNPPIDRSNMSSHPQPYWQKPSYYDDNMNGHSNGSSDNQNEVWMFESDNRCGYTDVTNTQPPSATMYHNRHHPSLDTQQQQQGTPMSRFYSDFDIIGELGHGSFGSVYKVCSYS